MGVRGRYLLLVMAKRGQKYIHPLRTGPICGYTVILLRKPLLLLVVPKRKAFKQPSIIQYE